jgi:hypothetical protein
MKNLLFFAAAFLLLASSMLGQSLLELRDILKKDEGHVIVAKLMKEAPELRRKEFLAMIVDLVKSHLAATATSKNNKIQFYNAVILLVDAGDEQAILDALKDGIGNAELGDLIEAIDALASCRGEEHTNIIERLARERLGILGDTLVITEDEDERRAKNDLLGAFAKILIGLASSANPSGMESARKIRDEFAVLYPSENGKLVLAAIDADLAKITPHKSALTRGPDNWTKSHPRDFKSPPTSNAPETGQGANSEKPKSSTPWSSIFVMIVAMVGLLWFLLKRLSHSSA